METDAEKLNVDSIIQRLLEVRGSRPGRNAQLSEAEIRGLCLKSREIFLLQPILLELEAPLKIAGDIHGQYYDLLRLFEYGGFPPESNYLFLGNYVDRGKRSIETICLLLAYKIKYPENFFLLRGNHECASVNRLSGFYDECKRRYNIRLWKTFNDCFNCLPAVAIIDEKIFCCHGGLSPELHSLEQIRRILRPTDVPDQGLLCDLLWANPDKETSGWGENVKMSYRECPSFTFGPEIVSKFLAKHDFDLVCRGNQVVEDGYEFFAKRQLVTLFSAPNFCGEFDNAGAVMSVDDTLMCSFQILKPATDRKKLFSGLSPKNNAESAKKLFDEAMEKGYVESRAIVLLLIGAAGAGKSHFKHLILCLPPPAVRESTPLAEAAIRAISICRATIGDGDMEWQLVHSQESLRMVADAIKAGAPVHLFPPPHFSAHVLPHDLTPIGQKTQPSKSPSKPSSKVKHSVPLAEKAPIPPPDTSPTSPSSISSTLESLDLSEPSQLMLEKELVDLISQSSGSKKLLDVDWVYIVDSGGQPQFHDILPAFIRYASACVFVTRLDKSLTDHPTIEYYGQGGQRHGTPYRSLLTHEQILQHCFQALQSRRCTTSSPQSGPMVFVAGTHKDLEHHCPETRDAKNKKLLESLRPVFGDKLGLYRLAEPDQLIFPVNAKTPSTEDKKVASEFRKMVTTSCPYEREKIPIPWFVLEQLIRQYATEKGVSIVSTKECHQIARRLHMGEEAFHAALDYLVALNIFHYYPTILPGVVFCDTQVLPDKMSELVEYSHMLRGSSATTSSVSGMQSHSGGWLRFRDEGIITVEFLREFPKHYVAGFFTPSDLLNLLSALLITAHLAGGEYFMPSLLYELQPDELDHYRCSLASSPSPLLVHYPGGWLPSGIYTSLIAYLQNVSSWKLLLKSGKPDCLHRNCVKFGHPGGRPGSITLIDSFTHFEVHLVTPKPVSPSLCCEIHRTIFEGLKQAVDTLSYTNLHPKEAFFCSARGEVCEPTPHLAIVGADRQWWSCSVNPEVGGELTEGQTLWLSSAEDRAQEKEQEFAEELKSPKPTQKPQPQPLPKPRQSAATDPDPTERVPYSADKPKLYQLQCLQCQEKRAKRRRWFGFKGQKARSSVPILKHVKIIETVAAKWEEVALALHFEGHTIQNIRYDTRIQCVEACREMFQKWLDGEGSQPVTWETLMAALVGAGFIALVEDLQEILRN